MRTFLTALLLHGAVLASFAEIFLNLDGIPGESKDSRHADWIGIESFHQGLERSLTNTRPAFFPLSVTKFLDKSSPRLAMRAANTTRIPFGTLEVVRLGADRSQLRYLQVKLTNITVVAFQQSGTARLSSLPFEEVALDFRTVEWTYTQFDATGRSVTNITCSWNRDTSTGIGGTGESDDADGDGIPDNFERQFGLNPELNDARADLDGDGASNIDEFRAGTFPNRADSLFQVRGRRSLDGQVVLQWTPVEGKIYRVLSAISPEGPFSVVRVLDEASVARGELTFQTSEPHLFFIIEVQ